MPIQFKCPTCRRKLSVGTHKAGSQAQCPNCGATVKIPTKEDVAAMAAMAGAAPADAPVQEFLNFEFIDDATTPGRAISTSAPREPIDPEYVSLPRGVLYAQGLLIAIVALVGFACGYLIGSGQGPPAPVAQPVVVPVVMQGKLSFIEPSGAEAGDVGAVIIVLPTEGTPDEKIPVADLRPDRPPASDTPIRVIQSLGGACVRTDGEGKFKLAVPRPGKYHVLRISRSAARPAGAPPASEDLDALVRYFSSPSELLGSQKYTWSTHNLAEGAQIAHNFGPSGQ